MQISIREDDPRGEAAALIRAHLESSRRHSPPESVHALDVESLCGSETTFWTAWQGPDLLGCAALRQLDPSHGEIKSMHTAVAHRGRGVATRLLAHLVAEARRRGYRRLSLETGRMAAYVPAQRLYARFDFTACGPFARYREDPHSLFMTLDLAT